jgi:methyl-accepting chemotaxis protein
VAQSSGHEARRGGGEEREQLSMLYGGIVGAAVLSAGLWIMRGWIARASSLELIAGTMVLLGGAAVTSVITALVLFSTRVDRASEDVASTLDALAAGNLRNRVRPARGLGREARLAGAAGAAISRLRSWLESSLAAVVHIEQGLAGVNAQLPRLRDAMDMTSAHVGRLTRDTRFLASASDEHGALTQRACVLAAVIGQSNRDTAAFAERVHATVRDAAGTLADAAARTAETRSLVRGQADDSSRCLEADRLLSEYLVVVAKSARQFKLLALHGAMEAARAGARGDAIVVTGGGAEFRVVALEVRRLAVSLAKATEDICRTVDGARRSLQSLHAAASEGERHVEAAQAAMSLGVIALDHATAAASGRRGDDAALAEAGTELTILTSAIRERSAGAAKGTGDVADRLATLEQTLSAAEAAARDIEQALVNVQQSALRARESVNGIAIESPSEHGAGVAGAHVSRGTVSRARAPAVVTPAVGAEA